MDLFEKLLAYHKEQHETFGVVYSKHEIRALVKRAIDLKKKINDVFEKIPRPKITLRVSKALDDEWFVSENYATELRKEDPETCWREIPSEKLNNHPTYFTFADPEGWLFYMPAFLTEALSSYPFSDFAYEIYAKAKSAQKINGFSEKHIECLVEFVEIHKPYC